MEIDITTQWKISDVFYLETMESLTDSTRRKSATGKAEVLISNQQLIIVLRSLRHNA